MPKILLAHPGTQHARFLASTLSKNRLLLKFVTSISFHYQNKYVAFLKTFSASLHKKLGNRLIYGIQKNELKTIYCPEFKFIVSKLNNRKKTAEEDLIYSRNKKFQQAINTKLINKSDIVIGFDTSSWIIAEKCKTLNKRFILDVSIGHPDSKNEIYKILTVKYPDWLNEISFKKESLSRLERTEMEFADLIVVPSHFVKRTYIENGIDKSKIKINPFGTNVSHFVPSTKKIEKTGVSFLFFGALTARKGLPFLLETWERLHTAYPESTLTIAGFGKLPKEYMLPDGVCNIGAINPSMRLELYHNHHVFVFPSFFEGFAQVQIEAAACGLPIIGSTNSGAEEMVANGQEGYVIEPGNKEELYKAMKSFIDDRSSIKEMGDKASLKAHKHFSWDAYGERWKNIIEQI